MAMMSAVQRGYDENLNNKLVTSAEAIWHLAKKTPTSHNDRWWPSMWVSLLSAELMNQLDKHVHCCCDEEKRVPELKVDYNVKIFSLVIHSLFYKLLLNLFYHLKF